MKVSELVGLQISNETKQKRISVTQLKQMHSINGSFFVCHLATASETVSPPIMGYTPPSSSILETILTGNRVISGKYSSLLNEINLKLTLEY